MGKRGLAFMVDQTAVPPPLPPVKKPTRFRKTRIVLFTIAIFWIGSRLLSHLSDLASPDLIVQKDNNNVITLTNKGSKPVTIRGATVNGRSDCKTGTTSLEVSGGYAVVGQLRFEPTELKVGDELKVYTIGCKVIRAAVETDQGSETYTFNGN
jgi:hypothetical protein